MKRLAHGFTLIELVITIAIIGVLSLLAFGAYTRHLERADIGHIQTAFTEIHQILKGDVIARNRLKFSEVEDKFDLGVAKLRARLGVRYNFSAFCEDKTNRKPPPAVSYTPCKSSSQPASSAVAASSDAVGRYYFLAVPLVDSGRKYSTAVYSDSVVKECTGLSASIDGTISPAISDGNLSSCIEVS